MWAFAWANSKMGFFPLVRQPPLLWKVGCAWQSRYRRAREQQRRVSCRDFTAPATGHLCLSLRLYIAV